jgi:hypothetical protein
VKDDAAAPVIAAMLILAVGVTFFAAWYAVYVPSMKAQSEITHIRDVETGFLRFSSDIDTAVSLKKNLKFSETIPLGGGEFTFDPVKSGGVLKVWNLSPAGYLGVNWTTETGPASPDYSAGMVRFSYTPVNNFWQEQGYGWSYGNIYVLNTGRNLSTPLGYATHNDVTYPLARSLVDIGYVPAYSSPGNCSSITLRSVEITPDTRDFRTSGNDNGILTMESTVTKDRVLNATSLNLHIPGPLPGRFHAALWDTVNASIEDTLLACGNIQRPLPPDPAHQDIRLVFRTYPWPNMTLDHETTKITIGTR